MVLPQHTCPYGVRARQLLDEAGFEVEEHLLTSREEVDALQSELGVDTTPQIFVGDERIGGCEELERYLASKDAH
jgi:glutaredoxin